MPVIDLTSESNNVPEVIISKTEAKITYLNDCFNDSIDNDDLSEDMESKVINYSLIEMFDLKEIIHQIAGLFLQSHIPSKLYIAPPLKSTGLKVYGEEMCFHSDVFNFKHNN